MNGSRQMGSEKQHVRRTAPNWLNALDHLLILLGVALALSLVYLFYMIFSGTLSAPIIAGSALESMVRNIGIARGVFYWTIWIILIAAMIRYYRLESVGYLATVAGVICWGILPAAVRSSVQESTAHELKEIGQGLVASFQSIGGTLIVIGVLRVIVGRVIRMSLGPSGSETKLPGALAVFSEIAQGSQGRASLMRKCWELHFCRGSLRAQCPRYLERTACWKKRSGCYCDEGLATRLLNALSTRGRRQAAEELAAAQTQTKQQSATSATRQTKRKPGQAPCRECPIYLEHQRFKYRALSWLSYPTAAITIGLTIHYIEAGYRWLDWRVANALSNMQVLPSSVNNTPFSEGPLVSFEHGVIILVGVLVTAIILHLTELAIFRLRW